MKSALFISRLFGGWLGLMSGGLSIPFAFLALFLPAGTAKVSFAILAFCALWVLVIKSGWNNYSNIKSVAKEKQLYLFQGSLTDRLRYLNGQMYKEDLTGEIKRETYGLITKIHDFLYDEFSPLKAAAFDAESKTQKPLDRFQHRKANTSDPKINAYLDACRDNGWLEHLDYIDARLDALKKINESLTLIRA